MNDIIVYLSQHGWADLNTGQGFPKFENQKGERVRIYPTGVYEYKDSNGNQTTGSGLESLKKALNDCTSPEDRLKEAAKLYYRVIKDLSDADRTEYWKAGRGLERAVINYAKSELEGK